LPRAIRTLSAGSTPQFAREARSGAKSQAARFIAIYIQTARSGATADARARGTTASITGSSNPVAAKVLLSRCSKSQRSANGSASLEGAYARGHRTCPSLHRLCCVGRRKDPRASAPRRSAVLGAPARPATRLASQSGSPRPLETPFDEFRRVRLRLRRPRPPPRASAPQRTATPRATTTSPTRWLLQRWQ
jgi:hypothetical protein